MDPVKPKPPSSGSGVLMSIQAMRGIATFIVIVAHIQLYVAGKLILPDLLPFYGVVAATVNSFFIVSGFIMVYASERLFHSRAACASSSCAALPASCRCTGSPPPSWCST